MRSNLGVKDFSTGFEAQSGIRHREYGYGYNAWGTARLNGPELFLGLMTIPTAENPEARIRSSSVIEPSDMVAIADLEAQYLIDVGPYSDDPYRIVYGGRRLNPVHSDGSNAVFVDGHVEYQKFDKWTEASDAARRRWNNDNQPHRETWTDSE